MSNRRTLVFLIVLMIMNAAASAQSIKPILSVPTDEKVVAITFDDGPRKGLTEDFLELFAANDVKATFFNIGENTKSNKELAQQVLDAGHEIGNHTMTHVNLTTLSDTSEIKAEILDFQSLFETEFEYKPTIFRAPFLAMNSKVAKVLIDNELKLVNAKVSIDDWRADSDSSKIVNIVKTRIAPGVIFLCHELPHTVDAFKRLIPELIAEGWQFVTVTQLLNINTGISSGSLAPLGFSLGQNYPNPFNPSTTIQFYLTKPEQIDLSIYNTSGQRVQTLVNEFRAAGYYTVQFNARSLPSANYIYRLETSGGQIQSRSMSLVK